VTIGASDETLRFDSASLRLGVGRPFPSCELMA